MATYYTITTTYRGTSHSLDYWPDGNGQHYQGYVTSLRQYRNDVAKHVVGHSHFDLIVVDDHGRSTRITNNDLLSDAVESLPNRGVLSVTAVKRRNDAEYRNADEDEDEVEVEVDNEDVAWNGYESEDVDSDDEYAYEDEQYRNASGKKALAVLKRFSPREVECYHCDDTQLCGTHYEYAQNSEYNLCGKCYGRLSKKNKRDWVAGALPWDSDAPSYPLQREYDGEVRSDVSHLQYLLTRLGFMSLSATSALTGSYQSNTEAAVRKFRTKYHLFDADDDDDGDDDMTVYDSRTAAKLAQVVRYARAKGLKYL